MTTKAEEQRKADKKTVIYERISEMHQSGGFWMLLHMMEEDRLDMMILALNLGTVELRK